MVFRMQFLNEALLVGAAQGLLLCVVILSIPSNQIANRLLALYVGLESLHLLNLHITYIDFEESPAVGLRLMFGIRALVGPALYLYVCALTNPRFRLRRSQLKHLWVLVFVLGWFGLLVRDPGWLALSTTELWSKPSTALMAVYQSLVAGGYALAAWRRLERHQRRLQQAVSVVDDVNLGWLQLLMAALVGITVLHLGLELLRTMEWIDPLAKAVVNLTVTLLLVYLISIGGLRQPQVFSEGLRAALAALEDDAEPAVASTAASSAPERNKYRKSGLDEARREEIWQQLQDLFEQRHPFLEPGLDLPGLARMLGVRPQELSEVINTVYGGSFYDLINHHRIEAAQALLRQPGEQHRKMLDIALSVGFSSQSTFYNQFRKLAGQTPTAYRQQHTAGQPANACTSASATRRARG